MLGRRWQAVCAFVATGVLALTALPVASATSVGTEAANVTDIPVRGTFTYPHFGKFDGETIVGAVHGVRRIPGATAVYYSVATEPGSGEVLRSGLAFEPSTAPFKMLDASQMTIVDAIGLTAYRPLFVKGEGGLVSAPAGETFPAGTLVGVYALLPELPAGVTAVDLVLEWGAVVSDLPVEDGPLLPASATTWGPVSDGWPVLPDAQRIAAADPAASTFELTSRVGDLEESTETDTTPEEVSVNLSADFFFSPGKWDLSAKGRARVLEVADELVAANVTRATVVGHTDSVPDKGIGNDKLSERRARTVADVLRERAPNLDLKVEGRGEAEPVAPNSTDAGKKKNRRVTVTYEVSK